MPPARVRSTPLVVIWNTVPSPPTPPCDVGPIKVPVRALYQPAHGHSAVLVAKAMQRVEHAVGAQPEDRAPAAIGASGGGGAKKRAVGSYDQAIAGVSTLGVIEAGQRSEGSVGGEAKDGSQVVAPTGGREVIRCPGYARVSLS